MKKFALFLAIFMLVSTTALVTGCANDDAQDEDRVLRFALVLPIPEANEVWAATYEGFRDATEQLGIEAIIMATATVFDVVQLNALYEAAMAEGVDGIVTYGLNPAAQAPALRELDEAGIPYVMVNSDAVDSNRIAFIGTGDLLGEVGGRAIREAFGDRPIRFATGLFALDAPIAISLHNAYLRELEQAPDFEELVIVHTAGDQLVALREWTNALVAHPEINAGMNIDGFGGLGAARAMRELGFAPGDIMMIAIDDVPETLSGIRDGYLYATMTQNFYRKGFEPVLWLRDYVLYGTRPAQEINDSGTIMVTMDNIDTFHLDMRDPNAW